MKEQYIGVFDSGVGGITVLHEAMTKLPDELFLYYADSANVPYGNKQPRAVKAYIFKAVEQMTAFNLKALVLACNTATSLAAADLRKAFDFPIIGMEPAIKPALLMADNRRVLVLGTPITLSEEKFEVLVNKLDGDLQIDKLPMQELVNYAEEFDFDSQGLKSYIKKCFRNIDWSQYHAIVLGCTHFIYFKELLKSFIPGHIEIFDGNQGTVTQLSRMIDRRFPITNDKIKCLLSGIEVSNEVLIPYLNYLKGESFNYTLKKKL